MRETIQDKVNLVLPEITARVLSNPFTQVIGSNLVLEGLILFGALQINAWFVENRHPETGEYPDFPDKDAGGSKIILNPPPVVEPVEPEEDAGKDKGKGKGKGGAKNKKEKGMPHVVCAVRSSQSPVMMT